MLQRDIYLASLNPTKGSEQAGVRPVVVISGDTMNRHFPVRIICPISSKMKEYPGCILLPASQRTGLTHDGEIITFQVRTVATKRLLRKLGTISVKELKSVFQGLIDVLRY